MRLLSIWHLVRVEVLVHMHNAVVHCVGYRVDAGTAGLLLLLHQVPLTLMLHALSAVDTQHLVAQFMAQMAHIAVGSE